MTRSILIVDDDFDTASLLAEALQQRGFVASGVGSARECLERLGQVAVDIVVTDLQMPGGSGLELCRELHAHHPNVLPLVITGQHSVEMAVAAVDAGAYDVITKPITIGALEATLSRALAYLAFRRESQAASRG